MWERWIGISRLEEEGEGEEEGAVGEEEMSSQVIRLAST